MKAIKTLFALAAAVIIGASAQAASRTDNASISLSGGQTTVRAGGNVAGNNTRTISWTASQALDTAVASVTQVTTGQRPTATIVPAAAGYSTCKYGNNRDSNVWTLNLTVTDSKTDDVALQMGRTETVQKTCSYSGKFNSSDANRYWTASSADVGVATVSVAHSTDAEVKATITAVAPGTATVTVKNAYITYTYNVTVDWPEVTTNFKGKQVTTKGAEVLSSTDDGLVLAWKSGTGSLSIPELAVADILVIGAGGGAGGGYMSGSGSPYWGDAGSAGEVKEFLAQDLGTENEGDSFTITVGVGGAGGKGGSYSDTERAQNAGKNGGASSIGSYTAAGGVGGQSRKSDDYRDTKTSVAGCGASDLTTPGSAGIESAITGVIYGNGGAAATEDGTTEPADAEANTGNGGDAPINPASNSTASTGAAGGSGYVVVRITDWGKKKEPVLSDVSATEIENGQPLSASTISGTATFNEGAVDGAWSWQTPDFVPTGADSDETEFTVVFTPADVDTYKVATATVTVHVKQEITWKDKTFTYTGDSLAERDEDGSLLFTFKGSGTINVPEGFAGLAADVLAVGAGGGGGGTYATTETGDGRGNGGDAGEVVEALNLAVAAGEMSVTVGVGGAGGARPASETDTETGVGGNGGASSVGDITAAGGAGGACGVTYADCAAGKGAGEGSDATNVTLVVEGTFGAGGAKSINHIQPDPTTPSTGNGGQAGSSQSDTAKQAACCPGRNGSDGYVVIRFKQSYIQIAVPTAEEDLTYDGTEQTGVMGGEGYTLTGNTGKDADDYTATATLADGYCWKDGTTDEQYIDWSIEKAWVMITPNSSSKKYGMDDPHFLAMVDGVVEGETLDYTLKREEGEDAGMYKILVELGENPNYEVDWNPGNFEIEKETLTAKADDKEMEYGAEKPEFTVSYSGWVDGPEDPEVAPVLDANYDSVGQFPIVFVTPPVFKNYEVKTVDGTLTVKEKEADWDPEEDPSVPASDMGIEGKLGEASFKTLSVWAQANGVVFWTGDKDSEYFDAFLLNCDPEDPEKIREESEAYAIESITQKDDGTWDVKAKTKNTDGKDYNGMSVILGSVSIEDPDWDDWNVDGPFFKAELQVKPAAE